MSVDLTFKCPRCGSSEFGSTIREPFPDGPLERLCHGLVGNRSCGFSWMNADDWMYMTVDGQKLNREQFEAVMEKVRNEPLKGS